MAERHWTQSGFGIAKKTIELTFRPMIDVYKAKSAEAGEKTFETAKKAVEFTIDAGPQIAAAAILTIPAVSTGVAGLGSFESKDFAQKILGEPLTVNNMSETYRLLGSSLYSLTSALLMGAISQNVHHAREEFIRIFRTPSI